jgi:hypothetical protein
MVCGQVPPGQGSSSSCRREIEATPVEHSRNDDRALRDAAQGTYRGVISRVQTFGPRALDVRGSPLGLLSQTI